MTRASGARQIPAPDPRLPVVIIGAGLCGLATARYLRRRFLLFEATPKPGGKATSHVRDGHVFDRTGHWLHLRDAGIRRMVTGLLGDELLSVERRSRIFSHGVVTPYPFQVNLHGLPPRVVLECVAGFLDRGPRRRSRRRPRSFEDFIYENYGEGIARHFMIPYNERLWGVHPREITDAWCRRFVPVPERDKILAGALGVVDEKIGYNARFLYPRRGGIEALPRALAGELPAERVQYSAAVERVDHRGRRVQVGGEWIDYRALVATLPLPELCRRLVAPPAKVVRAAERLRCTAVRYLDVALERAPPADYHWVYVPEARYPAYRIGIYSNASPGNAPRGGASLYVELASRGDESVDELLPGVIELLVAAGAMQSAADLKFAQLRRIDCAYVVFDQHYERARRTLLDFFEAHEIFPRGRYGSWDYHSMEDSMLQGRQVAQQLTKRYKRGPRTDHAR